jgi:hypothetical protein
MQSRTEFKQRIMNVVALVIASAVSGLTLWGVAQMAAADGEIIGAANAPWVSPGASTAALPKGGVSPIDRPARPGRTAPPPRG